MLSQVIISNIGGTATLIGDPPNVIIGSKVGLTFNQFLFNLGPPVVVIFVVVLAFIWATNRNQFKPINTDIIKLFTENLLLEKIRYDFLSTKIDYDLMKKGIFFLVIAILLLNTQKIK